VVDRVNDWSGPELRGLARLADDAEGVRIAKEHDPKLS
jgi:hypothetical protein